MEWERFCRRTNDPKLRYIEARLTEKGIAHRRNGESFHAPILEVDARYAEEAWALLGEEVGGGVTLDDVPDDDPLFDEYVQGDEEE